MSDTFVSARYRNAQPGETIAFGMYPQTAEDTDRMPIRWRVLHNSSGELLLLSERILDCRRYHRDYVDVTWRDCDLRQWLNHEFYHAAFDATESNLVKTALCTDNGENSQDTEDKVFLLGVSELTELTGLYGKEIRRAVGTDFAKVEKADGCRLYVYDKSVEADYLTIDGRRHGCSWWWLRTQLREQSRAAFVGTRASIRSYGRVNLPWYGVRPAISLSL